jgi:hypothetical protein
MAGVQVVPADLVSLEFFDRLSECGTHLRSRLNLLGLGGSATHATDAQDES